MGREQITILRIMGNKLSTNFIPIIDEVANDVGLVAASVYGVVWRYCQMEGACCKAAVDKIAGRAHVDRRTVIRHLKQLCDKGYLRDQTPATRNKPHEYTLTEKAKVALTATGNDGVTESHTNQGAIETRGDRESPQGVTESHSRCDRESLEESLKRDSEETTPEHARESNRPQPAPRPESTLQWRLLAAERISTKVKRAVLGKHYPDEYVIGAILQTYARYPNGASVDDLRGQLANALRDGDGVDEPYRALAALPAEVWTELILCARAANAHHAQPPVKYLSAQARAAWSEWARCFTAGERANREGEHFAPLLKGVPAHLREPGLRADVDDWLAARRAAQQEQAA